MHIKEILIAIEQRKQKFAQLPFFEFIQDESLSPEERLTFAPCIAPFVMSFGELNKYVFREEPTNNEIQAIINQHTYEDDHHWKWFVADLKKLGVGQTMNFTDTLKLLWGEKTKTSRKLIRKLHEYTFQADPLQKLVVIAVVEATAYVFLSASQQVARELQEINQTKYSYFGETHIAVDNGEVAETSEIDSAIEEISLTEETWQKYFELSEKVYELFEELTNDLLAYAKAHNSKKVLQIA